MPSQRHCISGADVSWQDLIQLYRRDAGGITPRFEDGRIIFDDARSLILLPNASEIDRRLRLAQRTVPNTSQAADVEYLGNAFVMLILLFCGVCLNECRADVSAFMADPVADQCALRFLCVLFGSNDPADSPSPSARDAAEQNLPREMTSWSR